MMDSLSFQTVISGQPASQLQATSRFSCELWDSDNAAFTQCSVPYVSAVPLLVICLLVALSLSGRLLPKRWRPGWTRPFVEAQPLDAGESDSEFNHDGLFWTFVLLGLSLFALLLQGMHLVLLKQSKLASAFLLASWTLTAMFLAIKRPKTCPSELLAFFISSIIAHGVAMHRLDFSKLSLEHALCYLSFAVALISLAVLMVMPLCTASPSSSPVSKVGSRPRNDIRGPEDSLRLYQFLTVSWVSPLLSVGRQGQLENEDVWGLGSVFQTARIAQAFRPLRGSIFRRLVRANGIELCMLVALTFARLSCDCIAPFLFQKLLLTMENPSRSMRVAMAYALLLWAAQLLTAQIDMLDLWVSRKAYERSRAELMITIHDKVMLRKITLDQVEQEALDPPPQPSSSGTMIEPLDGASGDVESDSDLTVTPNGTGIETGNKMGNVPKSESGASALVDGKLKVQDRNSRWSLLRELFSGQRAEEDSKLKEAASTGQVLNLMRSDVEEIAQRMLDVDGLIMTPLGIVLYTWMIYYLIGPSCLIGALVIVVGMILNGLIARVQLKWRRYEKKAMDARIQASSQFIESLRNLRFYAWHEQWLSKIMQARRRELDIRIISIFISMVTYSLDVVSGYIFPVVAFTMYTLVFGNELSVDLIFPALNLFKILQGQLQEVPRILRSYLGAWVALERLEVILSEPEIDSQLDARVADETSAHPTCAPDLMLEDCSFSWPGTKSSVLSNVNCQIGTGLTVVHGKIGSGKTAFLLSLLQEMDKTAGRCDIPNEPIGYCAQTPWLQSLSIRDNILFHSPYDEERYDSVLEACALRPDLALMKDGDLSEIGENGVGLSGGQRARVALARALYSRSRILLLDDPISALDHNAAQSIVRACFSGLLAKDRTIVLTTHRTALVHQVANQFIEVAGGHVTVSSEDPFMSDEPITDDDHGPPQEAPRVDLGDKKTSGEVAPSKFIKDEQREHGGIKAKVFVAFINSAKIGWILLGAMILLTQLCRITQLWFYKAWGEAYQRDVSFSTFIRFDAPHQDGALPDPPGQLGVSSILDLRDYLTPPQEDLRPWLIILFVMGLGVSLSLMAYAASQLTAVYSTNKNFYARAISRVTHATFRYYDVTPAGRILNRLTSDLQTLDMALTYFGHTVFFAMTWVTSMSAVASISPVFIVLVVALMGSYVLLFRHFLPASRGLKRLETVSLSPLFTRYGELLQSQGLSTVRAYRAQHAFETSTVAIIDRFQSQAHFYWSCQTWLGYRSQNISALAVLLLTVISLLIDLSAGLTAFLLANANTLILSTQTLCLRFGDLQTQFVSVERLVELMEDVEQEPPGDYQPPASWPRFGAGISFEHVTVRYAPELDPSLNDVSLEIPGGKTTAIIGRTGSGKSTLASALLNVVRADSGGHITIDGVSLTGVNVDTLRRRVTFIPQEPVLFDGTIHENLDPVEEFSAEECAAVLMRINTSANQSLKLGDRVASGGRNFSQGQRQLLGITRAVLRRSPIIIMDEATASVDVETSMKLQQIIREELSEATVITIAHRVEAVKGADYVIELEAGRVKRQGKVEDML